MVAKQQSYVSSYSGPILLAVFSLIFQVQRAHAFDACILPSSSLFVTCEPSDIPVFYSGYDVDLFRQVARINSWNEVDASSTAPTSFNSTFSFVCLPNVNYTEAVSQLSSPAGVSSGCDVLLGGIPIQSAYLTEGVRFSHAYLATGYAVATPSSIEGTSLWNFVTPFSLPLWLLFLATLLLLPPAVWLVERLNTDNKVVISPATFGSVRMALFQTMLSIFNLDYYVVRSFPAQLVLVALLLMVLVMVSTYTANLAAMTSSPSTSGSSITSTSDLRGVVVAGSADALARLSSLYGIVPDVVYDEVNASQFTAEGLDQLTSGSAAAFVQQQFQLQSYLANNPDVCVQLLPQLVLPYYLGIAFAPGFPQPSIALVNNAILLLQENGILADLASTYLPSAVSCTAQSGSDGLAATFSQMAGLWIIVGAVTGFNLLWMLSHVTLVVRKRAKELMRAKERLGAAADAEGQLGWSSPHVRAALASVFVAPPSRHERHRRYLEKKMAEEASAVTLELKEEVEVTPGPVAIPDTDSQSTSFGPSASTHTAKTFENQCSIGRSVAGGIHLSMSLSGRIPEDGLLLEEKPVRQVMIHEDMCCTDFRPQRQLPKHRSMGELTRSDPLLYDIDSPSVLGPTIPDQDNVARPPSRLGRRTASAGLPGSPPVSPQLQPQGLGAEISSVIEIQAGDLELGENPEGSAPVNSQPLSIEVIEIERQSCDCLPR